jgi:hypothetical protein
MTEANVVAGSVGTIVAERTLTLVGRAAAQVRVVIGKPRKDRGSSDYFCPYRLEGMGEGQPQQAWGVDSVQALQSAMQAIRVQLEPHTDNLQWLGGRGGSLGFPKVIPDVLGPKLTRRLEKMVERELDRHARMLERRSRSKKAGPAVRKKRPVTKRA